jgi:hypothetical protein
MEMGTLCLLGANEDAPRRRALWPVSRETQIKRVRLVKRADGYARPIGPESGADPAPGIHGQTGGQ